MADYSGKSGLLPCESCDMVFRSRALLAKHTKRFCIGGLTPEVTLKTQPSVAMEQRGTKVRTASCRGRLSSKPYSLFSSPRSQIMAQEQRRSDQEATKSSLKRLTEEVHTQHGYKLHMCLVAAGITQNRDNEWVRVTCRRSC